jgi:hypothetical protein
MATKDRFSPVHTLPIFLSDRTEEPARSGTMKIAVLATIAFVFMAAAIGFAIISAGGRLTPFANAKASQVSALPQDVAPQSEPTIQLPQAAATLPPTVKQAPTGDELIFAFRHAFERRAEVDQPPAEALINQFQAWAAQKDGEAQTRPPQTVRDARAQIVQNVPLPLPKPPVIPKQAARIQDPSPQNTQWLQRSSDWRN